MLFTFVAVAGLVPKGIVGHDAVIATKTANGKAIAAVATNDIAKTYAATLASVGGVFVLALFSSLVVTVAFAFSKRKGDQNG